MKQIQLRWMALTVILAVIAVIAGYFGWYLPRQPIYTVRLLQTAADKDDVATIYEHVDVRSILGHAIDDWVNSDEALKANPWSAALKPLAKEVGTVLIKDAIAKEVHKRAQKETDHEEKAAIGNRNGADREPDEKNGDDPLVGDMVQLRRAYAMANITFSWDEVQITTVKDGVVDVRIVAKAANPPETIPIVLRMRQLEDGTWQVYEIPNIMDVVKQLQRRIYPKNNIAEEMQKK
mgnify:CR=1 FL=1